jgi:hypothetical protein
LKLATENQNKARFLSAAQSEVLIAVLDRLIPADGGHPGAGDTSALGYVEGVFGSSPGSRRQLAEGLLEIESQSRRIGATFCSLSESQQTEALRAVERSSPAFFDLLVKHTYTGYYTDVAALEAAGARVEPPQPIGYALEQIDLSSLEKVKARGKIWRDA